MNKDEILASAKKMQQYLEEKPGSEPNELIERAENLTVLIAKSGKLMADAKHLQESVINGAILDSLQKAYEERLSPSTINLFVKTAARDFNYVVNFLDRINATATHSLEAVRSILSYRKSEMTM